MSEKLNKYFLNILKVLSFLLLCLYIYESYSILHIAKSEEQAIVYFILFYIFGYFFIVTLISSFRKLGQIYLFSILLSPLIPTLFYVGYLINTYSVNSNSMSLVNLYSNYIDVIDIIKIIFLYIGLIFFSKNYTDLLSDTIIRFIIGKNFDKNWVLGNDFPYVSIYYKMDNYDVDFKLDLIIDVIKNLLGYQLKDHTIVKDQEKEYDIFRFSRTHYHNFHRYKDNILLLPMSLVDINYLNWLDESGGDKNPPDIELSYLEDNEDNSLSLENDFEILEEVTYHCYFLKQYYEDEDEIDHIQSMDNETYLAFANILSNEDKFIHYSSNYKTVFDNKNADDAKVRPHLCLGKTLVIYYRKDEILSSKVWSTRSNLFSQYIYYNYGTLIDKFDTLLSNKFESRHLEIICIFLVFLVFAIPVKFLGVVNTFAVYGAIAAIIYTVLVLYDRYKGKISFSQILDKSRKQN